MNQALNVDELLLRPQDRIRRSAQHLFLKQGYTATTTRQIAEHSGENLALLNYYFGSKERLFAQIMMENLAVFMDGMKTAFNDDKTALEEKVTLFVNRYIDLLALQPDLPLFIFSSLRTNPLKLSQKVGARDVFLKSHFTTQYNAAVKDGSISELPIMHFVMNLVGMTVFPFVARPMLEAVGNLAPNTFDKMMQERRALIPVWIEALMNVQL